MAEIEKYTVRVEWSDEDDCYISRCIEFPSLGAHGESRQNAILSMESLLRATIEWMEEEGEDIPQPVVSRSYKGNISLRIPPDTHKELSILATEQGLSLNQMITSIIERNIYFDQIHELRKDFEDKLMILSQELEILRGINSEQFYKQFITSANVKIPKTNSLDTDWNSLLQDESCADKDTLSA